MFKLSSSHVGVSRKNGHQIWCVFSFSCISYFCLALVGWGCLTGYYTRVREHTHAQHNQASTRTRKCTHTRIHTRTWAHTHSHSLPHTYKHTYTHEHTHTLTRRHTHTQTYKYTFTTLTTLISASFLISLSVCVCLVCAVQPLLTAASQHARALEAAQKGVGGGGGVGPKTAPSNSGRPSSPPGRISQKVEFLEKSGHSHIYQAKMTLC